MKKSTPKKIECKPYNEEWHPIIAAGLARLGKTNNEIAEYFNVNRDTIYNWQKKYPAFKDALNKNKEFVDFVVEDSLLKKAIGGETIKEITFEKVDNKMNLELTPDGLITTDTYKKKIVTKETVADTTACIFWLKNRQPKKWRDKQEVTQTNTNIDITDKDIIDEVVNKIKNL